MVRWTTAVPAMALGSATAPATVSTLAALTLVLPTFTTSRPGPEFSPSRLAFAAVASITLDGLIVVVQTVRHRDDFPPVGTTDPEEHAPPPTDREALANVGLLLVALIAVVGLAKLESDPIEEAVASIGAPQAAVGVLIALLSISVVVGAPTVLPGRATVQEGGVHLVLFFGFVFLALDP